MRPPTNATRLQPVHDVERWRSAVGLPAGTPSTPAAAPTARNSRSIGPRSHTVRSAASFTYSPPVSKNCCAPPRTERWGDVGNPGRQPSRSYDSRIRPRTVRSELIHTRSSYHPNADFIWVPLTLADPFDPTATAEMMRPPSPRLIGPKRWIVPIEPV